MFENQLIKELCELAEVQKLCTMHYTGHRQMVTVQMIQCNPD